MKSKDSIGRCALSTSANTSRAGVEVLRVTWSEGACDASQVEHQDEVVAAAARAVPGFEVTIVR
jgi:hypothetical protein